MCSEDTEVTADTPAEELLCLLLVCFSSRTGLVRCRQALARGWRVEEHQPLAGLTPGLWEQMGKQLSSLRKQIGGGRGKRLEPALSSRTHQSEEDHEVA